MINSILDQDYYSMTVAQAVFEHFPGTQVKYKFINRRASDKFDHGFFRMLVDNVATMQDIKIQPDELDYLKSLNLFKPDFLKFIENYRFDPGQVNLFLSEEQLHIDIEGSWEEVIFWEVPLLALISQLKFENEQQDIPGFVNRTKRKRDILDNLKFIEFGTRRRRSFEHQRLALDVLKKSPGFLGTSNLWFAKEMNLPALGTNSHQMYQFMSSIYPVKQANYQALKMWLSTYHGLLDTALCDTFGSDSFFKTFHQDYHNRIFSGIRQDSGDPFIFTDKAIKHYKSNHIDPTTKTIYYSDGLNPKKCQEIKSAVGNDIKTRFCLGTNLTNDVPEGAKALQIVIKMTEVYIDGIWKKVCKLSDEPGKESGDLEEIKRVKEELNKK